MLCMKTEVTHSRLLLRKLLKKRLASINLKSKKQRRMWEMWLGNCMNVEKGKKCSLWVFVDNKLNRSQ